MERREQLKQMQERWMKERQINLDKQEITAIDQDGQLPSEEDISHSRPIVPANREQIDSSNN